MKRHWLMIAAIVLWVCVRPVLRPTAKGAGPTWKVLRAQQVIIERPDGSRAAILGVSQKTGAVALCFYNRKGELKARLRWHEEEGTDVDLYGPNKDTYLLIGLREACVIADAHVPPPFPKGPDANFELSLAGPNALLEVSTGLHGWVRMHAAPANTWFEVHTPRGHWRIP